MAEGLFPAVSPDVNVKLRQLRDGSCLFPAGQMVCFQANDPGQFLLSHQDRFSEQNTAVDSTDRTEFEVSVLCNGVDHQPNFVHVGGQHHFFCARAYPFFLNN